MDIRFQNLKQVVKAESAELLGLAAGTSRDVAHPLGPRAM